MGVVSVTSTVCHPSIPNFISPHPCISSSCVFSVFLAWHISSLPFVLSRLLLQTSSPALFGARADNTTLTYLNGFKRWRSWASKFSEITVLPAATSYVALYLFSVLQASTSPSLVQSAFYSIRLAHDVAGLQSPTSHTFPQKVLAQARRRLSHQTSKNCR